MSTRMPSVARPGRALIVGLTLGVALTSLAACGGSADSGKDITLRVYAAASLTDSFTALGKKFEAQHPGVEVQFNFGPSSGLAQQIGSGAPADVFASASPTNMDAVVQSKDAGDPVDFASNSLEVAVPADNPAGVTGLADLAKPSVKVALCQVQVPCGKVAAEVFAKANLAVRPATEEVDVKSVLTKVTLGEVDAGVVYVSDVLAAGAKVKGIEIPEAQNASTEYPIAPLTASEHPALARQFVDLVLSGTGSAILRDAGFAKP